MVTPRFPYPTTKGDKLRMFQAIRHVSRRHSVTLVAAADEPLRPGDVEEVAQYCKRVEVVPISRARSVANVALYGAISKQPLQTLYYRSARMRERVRQVLAESQFDVVHASLIRILPYLWDIPTPVVIDLVDSFARGLDIRAQTVSPLLRPAYRLEAERVRRYEQAACQRFAQLYVTAEPDRKAIGAANVSVMRACVDLEEYTFRREGRSDDLVVMTGNMGYQPNVDAVAWFAHEVWPLVRAQRPAATFRIVGTRPPQATLDLDGRDGITVVGWVENVSTELHAAGVAVCPVRVGSGLQIKVLEAMATGTPIVATSFGNAGIGAAPDREIAVADEPAAFASELLALLADPAARDRQAAAAHDFVEREFSWNAGADKIERLYEASV
jgi:sugar transferase (PEP-CTERM/EpsH1 system associated)